MSAQPPEVERLRAALTAAEWALTRLLTNTPPVLWLDHWIRGELIECDKALRAVTEALAHSDDPEVRP